MANRQRTKRQTIIYKTVYINLKIEQHEPQHEAVDEPMCSGQVRST